MEQQGPLADFLSRLGTADLSCLIALRVVLARADADGRVRREELLQGIRDGYTQIADDAGDDPADPRSLPKLAAFRTEETARYVDDHVLRRLEAEGILERHVRAVDGADGDESAEEWTGVALTSAARAELSDTDLSPARDDVTARLEERARELLRAESGNGSGAAVAAVREPAVPAVPPLDGGSTLSARGLIKAYRKRRVVNEVDVQVSQGEIVGLLGPNGAGKTTTFYMIVGLIAPDRGKVYLDDGNLTRVPMYRRARRGIGYLAQEPSIFRRLTVEENILAVLQMLGISRRQQRERLELLLDELGIKHLRATKAYALSGGERRRLEITRALVGEPKFMLLDEPFAGVDPIAVHDIQQIVADLRRRHIGVLISDHNVEQTLDIVDRAYIMYDGRVRVSGTVAELVWNDEVAEIYLGPTLTARMRQRYSQPEYGSGS